MPIPKIIHQIWIGPKPRPEKLMATFREKHPDFEYILWTEDEIERRGFHIENQAKYDSMEEWCGKADILRWEILYHYGGIYQDADSICLEPFDDILMGQPAFAAYENEVAREGLIAVGTMGFPTKHPLCREAIDWIATHKVSQADTGRPAWVNTGPGLLTQLLQYGKYPDFAIFPSYCFIPKHFTGVQYVGHGKVYCHQIWGTTKVGYDTTIDDTEIPMDLLSPPPESWVSVVICSYRANMEYIQETLDSIRNQHGYFGIELVWVDDCSPQALGASLEAELEKFRQTTRFTKVVFYRNEESMGRLACMKIGRELCTYGTILIPKEAMSGDYIQKYLGLGGGSVPESPPPQTVTRLSMNPIFDATMYALNNPFEI